MMYSTNQKMIIHGYIDPLTFRAPHDQDDVIHGYINTLTLRTSDNNDDVIHEPEDDITWLY